jgi:hypothetical protein
LRTLRILGALCVNLSRKDREERGKGRKGFYITEQVNNLVTSKEQSGKEINEPKSFATEKSPSAKSFLAKSAEKSAKNALEFL